MARIDGDKKDGEMLGVRGTWRRAVKTPELWYNQKFVSVARTIPGDPNTKVRAEIRFDDMCGNKFNSFAVTGTTYYWDDRRGGFVESGGRYVHEQVAAVFPEFAHLIRWHLFDTRGPMHYVANTVYLAGDRDHNGKRKGEPWAWDLAVKFGDNPITHKLNGKFAAFLHSRIGTGDFQPVAIAHAGTDNFGTKFEPKWTFAGFGEKWHDCPFDTQAAAVAFAYALKHCAPEFLTVPTLFSEGKERQLDYARRTAVWPEATDAELSVEPDVLKVALLERLPALVEAFERDVRAAGFFWTPSETPAQVIEG